MPRVPKLEWGTNREAQFRAWIDHELTQTLADRTALDAKWADQIVQWRAQLPKGSKDFPWPGAANYEFPLTAIHADPVYADMMTSLHTPEDYWSPTAKRPDRVKHANPLREFMTALDRNFLKMRQVNGKRILDLTVHGTSISKNHWDHSRKPFYVKDPQNQNLAKMVRIHSVPRWEAVPLQHFYIPANSWDVDPDAPVGGAAWVSQKFWLTGAQLQQRAKSDGAFLPDYDPAAVALVEKFLSTKTDTVDDAIQLQEEYQPFNDLKLELFEIHARFDADGDGVEEDILVIYHQPSREILRAVYSPFLHGKRPFHKNVYWPTFGFYGIGLAEMNEWSQQLMSSLMNATVDNTMLVNTGMFSAPYGSTLRPGEPIYPGRVINYTAGEHPPARIEMGEINASLPGLQQFVLQVAEMRDGVSELRQGNITNLPGRTPATTVLGALSQSSKRFALVMSNFRDVDGEGGLRVLQNVAQFYDDDPKTWEAFCTTCLGPEDAQKVIEVLQGQSYDIEASFGVSVSATNEVVNKESEKQNFLQLMQISAQIYGQLVQTAALAEQAPQGSLMRETAAASYSGGVQLLQRLYEKYDIQNASDYLGNMDKIAEQMAGGGQEGAQPGMQPPGMPGAQPGMGGGVPFGPYPGGSGIDPTIARALGLA